MSLAPPIESADPKRPSRARHLAFCVLYVLVGAAFLLAAATVGRVLDAGSTSPEATTLGTAVARECVEHGPIGLHGIGTSYTCVADVRWDSGWTERVKFPAGQLSPADVGRQVAVFVRTHDGRGSGPDYGVNDTAKWAVAGVVPTMLLVLATGIAMLIAAIRAYQAIRPGVLDAPASDETATKAKRGKGRRSVKELWPLSKRDAKAAPWPRIAHRLLLLSLLCVVGVTVHVVGTIPRYDAPRAVNFVSPWPQIEQANLVRLPDFGVIIIGGIAAFALLITALSARTDAARVVRYGKPFLVHPRSVEDVDEDVAVQLKLLEMRKRSAVVQGALVGLAILALGAFAAFRAVTVLPADPPVLVTIGALRDALVLCGLGVILLATIQSKYDRLSRLLRLHEERFALPGTDSAVAESQS